jgi:hypothetical protein
VNKQRIANQPRGDNITVFCHFASFACFYSAQGVRISQIKAFLATQTIVKGKNEIMN